MAQIRYALRSLAKAPLLSLVVILSLGLGIGANTAIFSLLHQVVLSSLPVPRPNELVLLTSPGEFKGGRVSTDISGGTDLLFSYPMFRGLEKQAQGVTTVSAFRNLGANLVFGNQTYSGSVMVSSGAYFPTLGVKPLIGRTIGPEDDQGVGNPAAVLSYSFWNDKLGGEAGVLNQQIRINGQSFTIVGVAPKGFSGTTLGQNVSAWVPLVFKPLVTPNWDGTKRWDDYYLYSFARLKPGVSVAQAQAALNGPFRGLVEEQSKTRKFRDPNRMQRFLETRLTLKDGSQGSSGLRSDNRTPLLILMAATVMVLLIAVANAANLLLARAAQRKRELAIRAAMGGARRDLMRPMLLEALLLASGGGVAGIALGAITLKLLYVQISGETPANYITSSLDWPVMLFAIGLSAAAGLLFGLYPAWDAARSSVAGMLKNESGQASSTRSSATVRRVLVCAQVTISAALLIPTGLFLKSMVNLLHVNLGIRTENVIGFAVEPSLNGYKREQAEAFFERAEQELAAIPGVRSVATSLVPLIANENWMNDVKVEGNQRTDLNSNMNEIGPGFFGKMGIPLIAGREFTESDNLTGPKVGIVNQQFAKEFIGDRNPIGLHFGVGGAPDIEIVGVVKNSHYAAVKQDPPKVYYTPWRQDKVMNNMNFYVSTGLPAEQVFNPIRRAMQSIDRDLPLVGLRTLDQQVRNNIQSDRLIMQLAAAFAILATSLAMLGLYGVMAYSVTRRTREIGIRMALGAGPGRIRGMVMREMLWILAIGLVVGIPSAQALSELTRSELYGVQPSDWLVVAGAALALGLAAAAAGYLPARRASRVSPLVALRYE